MLVNRMVRAKIEISFLLARRHRAAALLAGCALLLAASAFAARKASHAASLSLPPSSLSSSASSPAAPHASALRFAARHSAFDISATPVTTVSAASYEGVAVAPDSIVAAFGANLATRTELGADTDPNTPGVQLPTQLAGTTVEVNGRRAGLFFVSQAQVNYLMPADTESGSATVVVRSGDGTQSNGTVQVARVAPGIFAANSDGKGVPAASALRVKNGVATYEPIAQSTANNGFVTKPIDLGGEGESVFLILYLTGLHQAPDPNGDGNLNETVRALIGGNEVTPAYVGRVPGFVGLNQINLQIPRSLIGRGIVSVSITPTGFTSSNLVNLEIAGNAGSAPPQIDGFGEAAALVGQELTIMGRGFAAIPRDNSVRIGGLDATVVDATPTQLRVMVPFGVQSAPVSVRTLSGEGVSPMPLPVRTSISGTVETTSSQPLSGVTVSIVGSNIITTTTINGAFVLADVPNDIHEVVIDGGSVGTNPPFPKLAMKVSALKNRDNQITRPIALQQITGSSGTIGGGSFAPGAGGDAQLQQADPAQQSLSISTGDFRLEVPTTLTAAFPGGATRGTVYLTPLKDGRTPVDLPLGYYSSSVVQITPFNVALNPGAKLIFPNTDVFTPGTPATLFRYDPTVGKFVEETAKAAVSADGRLIETEPGAIKTTSYYFAAVKREYTTITGRVLEKDGATPVNRALVNFRGREAYTDGSGSYVLRYVPVKEGERAAVEVRVVRANLRVDRAQSEAVTAVLGGTTKLPDVLMPSTVENRPPSIIIAPTIEIDAGKTSTIPFVVTDPDTDQTVQVGLDGASFAVLVPPPAGNSTAYSLGLSPDFTQFGKYTLIVTATDSAGASVREEIALTVRKVNGPPTAVSQSVSGDEDTTIAVRLQASDRDGDRVTFIVVTPPANGTLSGTGADLIYKPALNFNGKDRFTFKANDGALDSAIATVNITVNPVNDAPVITVAPSYTGNEAQPLNFTVTVFDPDTEQKLTMEAQGLPDGAAFEQVTSTSWQFRWLPSFNQAGTYYPVFKVTDNGTPQLSDTKDTKITISDTPLFSVPGPKTINEGQTLTFDVTITPNLSVGVTLTVFGQLPIGAQVTSTPSGLQFTWTPTSTQAGTYPVRFLGRQLGQLSGGETRDVLITVLDTQRDLSLESNPLTIFGASGPQTSDPGDGGDAFGAAITVGDLNGDGAPDLVVGAPGANGGVTDTGKVYVFFNRFDQNPTIDLAQRRADLEISGASAGDNLGASLAIGDTNGDGKADLIIGAPLADADAARIDSGKVYILFGPLTAGSDSVSKLARTTLLGATRGDRFGAALAVGPFRNRTGALDLFIGAPRFAVTPASGGPALGDAGAVYCYFGGASLANFIDAATNETRASLVDPAGFVLNGTSAGGQLGAALAVGNFNGDDLADLAVGAPLAVSSNKASGAVWVVSGGKTLSGVQSIATAAAFTLAGTTEGDNFGAALAFGDSNGDGRADLLIGAPGADNGNGSQFDVGRAYVLLGSIEMKARPFDLTIIGAGGASDSVPDALGTRVATGDFNGDGLADFILSAPGSDPTDVQRDAAAGGLYVLFGVRSLSAGTWNLATKPADYAIWGARGGDALGAGGIVGGEVSRLLIGAPKAKGASNTKTDAGEVRMLNGVRR